MSFGQAIHVPIRKVMQHWFTAANNQDFDPVRGMGILAIVADTVMQGLNLTAFNPINYMGSIATVLTIMAGSDKLQSTPLNRPTPPPPEGPSTVVNAPKVELRGKR